MNNEASITITGQLTEEDSIAFQKLIEPKFLAIDVEGNVVIMNQTEAEKLQELNKTLVELELEFKTKPSEVAHNFVGL